MEKIAFTQMKDGTKEEYDFLTEHETDYAKDTAKRLMKAMVELDEGLSGYLVTRLGHSLQSATQLLSPSIMTILRIEGGCRI